MTEEQIDKAETLLGYYDIHAEMLAYGPRDKAVHREGWMGDAATLLREMLPEWSAFKEAEMSE